MTDYLPQLHGEYGNHYDVLKDGSLEITGLLPGESYDVSVSTGMLVITFFKDPGQDNPGLQASETSREVHVRLTTMVEPEWLELGYEHGGRIQNHTNTIDLNGVQDTATVIFGKPGIEKTGETEDGR